MIDIIFPAPGPKGPKGFSDHIYGFQVIGYYPCFFFNFDFSRTIEGRDVTKNRHEKVGRNSYGKYVNIDFLPARAKS